MKRSIIRSLWGVLLSLGLFNLIIGCSTASSSQRSVGSRALVNGTPPETITRVIQWCERHRCEVLNHGKSFLAARIKEYRFMDGEFVFEGNCGISPMGSLMRTLNDPRIKVIVEDGADQTGTSVVTVVLSGRSDIGDCRSSGVLEQSLFEFLGAMPLQGQ